jgi:hypothetical protein
LRVAIYGDIQQGLEVFAPGTTAFDGFPVQRLLGADVVGVAVLTPIAAFAFFPAAGAVCVISAVPALLSGIDACAFVVPRVTAGRAFDCFIFSHRDSPHFQELKFSIASLTS